MALYIKNSKLRRIAFFFPIQLFLVVLKKNQLLVLFWLILFGFITKSLAPNYGVPFLFLGPEYLDRISFWSYLFTGFALGGFIMAFNISSYIMNAFRFPFLATLSNPFLKYCLNNIVIPALFVVVYIVNVFRFQLNDQLEPVSKVFVDLSGFLLGLILFFVLSFTYFLKASKDIYRMFGVQKLDDTKASSAIRPQTIKNIVKKNQRDWYVETYLATPFSIRLSRKYNHYKKGMLIKVFKQNHSVATVFELLAILSLLILGLFRDVPLFQIPAAASVILLFTAFIMLASAIHTFLRGWATTVTILFFVFLNLMYGINIFDSESKAYGLNYKTEKAEYTNAKLIEADSKKAMKQADINYTIEILNKWRLKNSVNSNIRQQKPKMILINTSGGGLRSTLWTTYSLLHIDSCLNGELLKHVQLITGSSGGMLGASYVRELYLRYQNKEIQNLYDPKYVSAISADILNPIAFSIATNDLFFRFQRFKDGEYNYSKDRGQAFETRVNENTKGILDKRLKDYLQPEKDAKVPMVVMAPTIVNDGRKLLISPQPISYLTQNSIRGTVSVHPLVESIEFSRFFEKQNAENLKYLSALRMNATFPYITPVVNLPSEPVIQVIDAGLRDNYGLETTFKFLYTFRNWITTNTSGVIVIQIRDKHKEDPIEESLPKSITGTLSQPLGSFYGNWFAIQDFNQNQLIEYASLWFDGKIDFIDLEMHNEKKKRISLSWHLTNREKKAVLESINLPQNQEEIRRLKYMLE
ncbi:MAG: patatin-like phospholipase family protein [Bacteroidetes bacterium]|nr:patatin-like phospholipase family protein [Bacteroidota bacterium]